MDPRLPLLDPALVDALPAQALNAVRVVEGVLTGIHASPHHGQSVEFAEYKQYTPGDSTRHIDWKVYARSDRHYVKRFERETNVRGYLLVDRSPSMEYGSGDVSKARQAGRLALCFAWLLFRQQDAAGLITFGESVREYLPPRGQPAYLLDLARCLEKPAEGGRTSVCAALRYLAEAAHRRSLILIFSDLLDPDPEIVPLLNQTAARGHDLVVFQVLDRDELTFPFQDLVEFEDLEAPEELLLVEPRSLRSAYLAELERFTAELQNAADESGFDLFSVSTDDDPGELLMKALARGRAPGRIG